MKLISHALLFLSIFIAAGCSSVSKMEENFNQDLDIFFAELWMVMPEKEMIIGGHKYDHLMPVLNKEEYNKRIAFLKKYETSFSQFDTKELTVEARADLALVVNFLKKELWELRVFKRHEWDASFYNIGPSIQYVLLGNTKSKEDKLKALYKKMQWSTAYYARAKKNLKRPTKTHINLAINQHKGLLQFMDGVLKAKIQASGLREIEKVELDNIILIATKAIKDYVKWLRLIKKKPTLVGGFRDFRIGPKLYKKKFELDLMARSSAAFVYSKAKQQRVKSLKKMKELSLKLWPKHMGNVEPPKDSRELIYKILNKLSEKKIEQERFVEATESHIYKLYDFIRSKNLFDYRMNKVVNVKETAEYLLDFSLDVYSLQILNMYETVPGHLMQMDYAKRNTSLTKTVFPNQAFVHGWSVYAARTVFEAGYADNSPELLLMFYKWFLGSVTDIIIDYEIHNKGLSREDAFKYMIEFAFQEKEVAKDKWLKAKRSQVQLSRHYTGFNEIYSFREEYKRKLGDEFDIMEFHEEFLSHGSAAVRTIRTLMIDDLE